MGLDRPGSPATPQSSWVFRSLGYSMQERPALLCNQCGRVSVRRQNAGVRRFDHREHHEVIIECRAVERRAASECRSVRICSGRQQGLNHRWFAAMERSAARAAIRGLRGSSSEPNSCSGTERLPCARSCLPADCLAVRDLQVQALEAFHAPIRALLRCRQVGANFSELSVGVVDPLVDIRETVQHQTCQCTDGGSDQGSERDTLRTFHEIGVADFGEEWNSEQGMIITLSAKLSRASRKFAKAS